MSESKPTQNVVTASRREGTAVVVSVRGEIDLHNSPELRARMLQLLNEGNLKKLILNLAEVPYMDSSAIAVLVEGLQKLRKTGGVICLTNLQLRVKGLLEIARLNTIFQVFKDEADALK